MKLRKLLLRKLFLQELNEAEAERERLAEARREVEELRRSKAVLEAMNNELQSQAKELGRRLDESMKQERFMAHLFINLKTQEAYGIRPYSDAPGLPEHDPKVAEQPDSPVMQGSAMVRAAREKFLANIEEMKARGEKIPVDPAILRASLM